MCYFLYDPYDPVTGDHYRVEEQKKMIMNSHRHSYMIDLF